MNALVCSGATVAFDALVEAIDADIIATLQHLGFSSIDIQFGHAEAAWKRGPAAIDPRRGITVSGFAFDPDIASKAAQADLVITHAGTGSLMDALRAPGRPSKPRVVAVINPALMDNHQAEVAEKLAEDGQLVVASGPLDVGSAIIEAIKSRPKPLQAPASLVRIIPPAMALP